MTLDTNDITQYSYDSRQYQLIRTDTMLYRYNHIEYADMIFVYGVCHGSDNAAIQEHRSIVTKNVEIPTLKD